MDFKNLYSLTNEVAGENMSNLSKFCKNLRATLDSVQNYNTVLQQEILQAKLEGCCENDEFLVLNSVVEAALKENQSLQNELQRVKNIKTPKQERLEKEQAVMKQEKVKHLIEHFELNSSTRLELEEEKTCVNEEIKALQDKPLEPERTNETDFALLRSQQSHLHELYQGLQLKLMEEEALKKRRDQLKTARDCICEENEATLEGIKKLFKKVSNTDVVREECEKLEKELEVLRGQNGKMRQEFECLKSKLKNQGKIEDRSVQLKAEISRSSEENLALNGKHKELQKKVFNFEAVQEECGKLEEELEMIRSENEDFKGYFQYLESEMAQDNVEEQYVQLQSERDRCSEENAQLRDNIEKLIKKFALESCWKKKSEALELSKGAFESENMQLKEHLWNITVAYDAKKAEYYKYMEKVNKIQHIKASNGKLMQEIEDTQQNNINLKAMSESYKDIDKKEAAIEAIYKKLVKKKFKLEKESQQFKDAEVEVQQLISDSSQLRQQNSCLYKEIAVLEDLVSRKGLLKTHLKSLRKEKQTLMQRQNDLKTEIANLEKGGKKKLVDRYLAEYKKNKDDLVDLQDMNDHLLSQYEELFTAVFREETLEFSNENVKNEMEEMAKLNKKHRAEFRQERRNRMNQAGPRKTA